MARRTRRSSPTAEARPKRDLNYRHLRNPFPVMDLFEAEEIAGMHATALRVLEELGIKVLLPEARKIYRTGGARVENEMVHIGREVVEAALATAPRSIACRAGSRRTGRGA